VPPAKLLPGRTYMFFSHTIKAQPYNMPMLDDILAKVLSFSVSVCLSVYMPAYSFIPLSDENSSDSPLTSRRTYG
jgi:hypothetical protein